MDDQRNYLLDWPYYFQGKSMEELTQSLLLTTLEIETTRLRAQEELRLRDDQLNQLKDLLNKAITERDEAQSKCQALLLEKLFLQQHYNHQTTTAPHSGISSIEDEPRRGLELDSNNGFSSSDCEGSIVSSPVLENPIPPPPTPSEQEFPFPLVPNKALPEKGKLLEAVMKAGPLLQNLLLAGPLPLWRHPPPPLDTYQIPPPPVVIPSPPQPAHLLHQDSLLGITARNNNINNCGSSNRKRGLCEGSDSSSESNKYQRVVLN